MASEIRVDKINSLSGVGTVTLSPTGVDIAGITTAATLKATTGIVTTLTATTGIVTTFESTTGNITTLRAPTGISTHFTADKISLPDSTDGSLCIGIGSDLKFNHNGTDSFITEVGGGDLYIQGSDIILRDAGTLEKHIEMTQNGAVDIYHNGTKKLETTSTGATLSGDLTISDKIIHSGDTNTAIRFPAADTVSVETGGSEAIRVDSNGYIGIGANDPHLYYSKTLVVNATTEGDGGGITIRSGGTTHTNYLMFADSNSGAARYEGYVAYNHNTQKLLLGAGANPHAELDSTGDLTISDGDLVIGTSGHGIDFSATGGGNYGTDTSELLDDYEEGTWTPAFTASTGGSATTNVYSASYTKIGNLVNVTCYIGAGSNSSTTGNWTITGLPYINKGSNHYPGITIPYWNSLQGNINVLTGTVQPGTTTILIRGTSGATTATSNLSYAAYVGNGTEIIISATYLT